MVKVNDILFDTKGYFYKVVFRTDNFVKYAVSHNNVDYSLMYVNYRIDEIEHKLKKRELFFYTKANWILYGKKENTTS